MASIRKVVRKDGSVAFQVLYRIDGRQSSLPLADRKSAEQFAALVNSVGAARALEIHGIDPAPTRRAGRAHGKTVKQFLDEHIDHLTGVRQYTIDCYRRYVRLDIGPVLGDIPLAALTEHDISRWVQAMEDAGAAPKTIKNKHGFLSGALAKAVPNHMAANPAAGRRLPTGDGDDHEPVFLSRDEYQLLLSCFTAHWRPLIEFLVHSGCRWGEAAALRPSDVDREACAVHIRRAWNHSSDGYQIGPTKTRRSKRTIRIPAALLDRLDYSHEYLFVNTKGGPVRAISFHSNVWRPAVTKSKLDPKPRIHDLRHTHASWLLNDGVPMAVVSRRLGHESVAITDAVYAHIADTSDQLAADVMGRFLS